jgi:hypothetical protein
VLRICLGIVILLTALARCAPMSKRSGDWGRWAFISDKLIVMGVGTTCKNRDEFINYTVRVSKSDVVFFHWAGSVKKAESSLFFLSLSTVLVQKRVDYNLSDQQDLSIE